MNTRQDASNGFVQGLLMDYNPINAPNTALTNALNATFVTYNGNEGILQNDLGNGRVESAYLPEGFIPLGTTSFGGIIYVVSYNPIEDVCQVGSFPSPERNFTEGELYQGQFGFMRSELLNDDEINQNFQINQSFQIVVPLLDQNNKEIRLTSGDKFTLILPNIDKYYGYLQGLAKNGEYSTNDPSIRLVLGIRRDGQLRELSYLQNYNSQIDTDYGCESFNYITLSVNENTEEAENALIDSYRDLIESPYNIVNCNISGTLCLIVKIVTLDTFNEVHKIKLNENI